MKTYCFMLSAVLISTLVGQIPRVQKRTVEPEKLDVVSTSSLTFSEIQRVRGTLAAFVGSTPETGHELWITDGTPRMTTILADIREGPASSNPQGFIGYDQELFFYADDGVHGLEVWRTDGTSEGTKILADLVPGAGGMIPIGMSVADHRLFIPVDPGNGRALVFYLLTREEIQTDIGQNH